jgi:hypothetical protein
MPSIRRRRPDRRREFDYRHFAQLRSGLDFFGSGWGDHTGHGLPEGVSRDNWPTAEILNEMRECWELHSEQIKADNAEQHRGSLGGVTPTWGELVFERGLSPEDAFDEQSRLNLEADERHFAELTRRNRAADYAE